MCGTIERRYFSIYLCTRSGSIWSVGSSQPVTFAYNRMRGCTAKPSIFAVCEMQVECIFAFLMDKSVSSCVVFLFFLVFNQRTVFSIAIKLEWAHVLATFGLATFFCHDTWKEFLLRWACSCSLFVCLCGYHKLFEQQFKYHLLIPDENSFVANFDTVSVAASRVHLVRVGIPILAVLAEYNALDGRYGVTTAVHYAFD